MLVNTEPTNTAALALYRSLGFVAHHTQRAFVGNVI